MSFDQDPDDQAQISAGDFALMCDQMKRLRHALYVNTLRAFPKLSHEEIEAEINKALDEPNGETVMGKARIVVEVKGGNVQAVYSSVGSNVSVAVLDHDNLAAAVDKDEIEYYEGLKVEVNTLKEINYS